MIEVVPPSVPQLSWRLKDDWIIRGKSSMMVLQVVGEARRNRID